MNIKLFEKNGLLNEVYSELVTKKIRKVYSVSAELAILRQRDSKPEEFEDYNTYAEECKSEARKEIYGE